METGSVMTGLTTVFEKAASPLRSLRNAPIHEHFVNGGKLGQNTNQWYHASGMVWGIISWPKKKRTAILAHTDGDMGVHRALHV
jgi:hypothetical protein